MNKKIIQKTITPSQEIPLGALFPNQTHGTRIVEIVTGTEDLTACDGIWTRDSQFLLGVQTADCAPICFQDSEKFGIVHAGWRGLCDGIIEKMLEIFQHSAFQSPDGSLESGLYKDISYFSPDSLVQTQKMPQIFVGPILSQFEIQKDFCYDQIEQKFSTKFFSKEKEKLIFDFQSALQSVLPPQTKFDPRSTFDTPELASWRRDRNAARNKTLIGDFERFCT
jgi:copper oxidase (laccase) domain-containing protein